MALTHFNEEGRARMVDVSAKNITVRTARAGGKIFMRSDTLELVRTGGIKKGDVLAVAQVAGIMAAKRTADMIPLCHPLPLAKCSIDFTLEEVPRHAVYAAATVKVTGETGVEMEALHAVSTALLTIYDMCKAIDKRMEITDIHLERKSGGKSGTFVR